jgi:hypothetical protein
MKPVRHDFPIATAFLNPKISDMTKIERIEASAATQAATGITHYMVDATNGWKALGANDAEIATHVVSKEERGKGVLRVDTHDRHVEITYSIESDDNNTVIDAVVNGNPSKLTFSKEGGLVGEGLKKAVDPAIHEMFRSICSDLMAHRGAPRITDRVYDDYRCRALITAAVAAHFAGELIAEQILIGEWWIHCAFR